MMVDESLSTENLETNRQNSIYLLQAIKISLTKQEP
jgi:hypothetical protein